ncbi:MAG: hypothetical protein BM556_17050 [Bacteriovorax sp. MedPE-SWde]|nr:MAG: hypothetical protein BM556_17050 [Bacteriovorax sp. MedPE-SWde]
MRIFLITIAILSLSKVAALPKKVDIIFLSASKTADLKILTNEKYPIVFRSIAMNKDNCVPMGDGCFHPQLGFIEGKSEKSLEDQKDEKKAKKLKTINSMDTNMIDCKEGNYWDIFCGKAKPESHGPVDFEVWIDTSSSLRNVDWSKDNTNCYRRSFVERLKNKCSIEVQTFDTSKKQMGGLPGLCINYGLNDQKRLMNWIDESNAKHLILVTDIDEGTLQFREYLMRIGANLYGADTGDFDGDKLLNHVETLSKTCQNRKK